MPQGKSKETNVSLTDLTLGDEQAFDSPEFGDLDSGDVRQMQAVDPRQNAVRRECL
jgi:hypothetical protein